MGKLKEEVMDYEPPKTKNVSDLEVIPIDIDVLNGEGKTKEGKIFKYKYIEVDGEEYRIPGIVLGSLKEILKVKPNLKFFKVNKKGEGIGSQYTVIQLDEPKEVKTEEIK